MQSLSDIQQIIVGTVQKLELHPGDVLHIKVGGHIHLEDGKVQTWVPTQESLAEMAYLWHQVLPEDVQAIVTHNLVEPAIVQSQIRVSSWPPKTPKP